MSTKQDNSEDISQKILEKKLNKYIFPERFRMFTDLNLQVHIPI